jgi:tripartite-type tricarboxylate transporter receptor subunit TctC
MKKLLLLLAMALLSMSATAQLRIIVPYAAGGAFDQMARNFGKYIETTTGESVFVENVTGVGSIIGTKKMLDLNPNRTILFTNSSHYMNIIQGQFKEEDFKMASMNDKV